VNRGWIGSWLFAIAGCCVTAAPVSGQENDAEALAKAAQNPIADMTSLPLPKRPLNLRALENYYVEKPDAAASWQLRFRMQLILPKSGAKS